MTKFEDLEYEAVLSLGNVTDVANKSGDTLKEIDKIKYDTFGEALSGAGRLIQTELLLPIQDKLMPGVNNLTNAFREGLPKAIDNVKGKFSDVYEKIKPMKEFVEGIIAILSGNKGKGVSILATLGLTSGEIQTIINNINKIQDWLNRFKDNAIATFQSLMDRVQMVWALLLPYIKPVLNEVVSFVGGIIQKITKFWDENGTQILSAVENAFKGIMAIVKFVMPLVLGIIKSIWGNIKGVINGALDIIMGAVKVFSGLFTGDFKKMWEGIKQMFKGAIQFVWNFIQLTFFGKILKGAKAFITTFKSGLLAMWQGIVALFKGNITKAWNLVKTGWTTIWNVTKSLFKNIWNFLKDTWNSIKSIFSGAIKFLSRAIDTGFNAISGTTIKVFKGIWSFLKSIWTTIKNFVSGSVSSILKKVKNTWSSLWNNTKDIFSKIYNSVKGRFSDIVSRAKELPGKIGDAIGKMASKVKGGVTKVINALAKTLGKGVNGVIGGVNWVLGKIGVDSKVPKWDVPQYAKGTKSHPGGMAWVGDGKGSNAGSELIQSPDGSMSLSPDKPTLVNMAKGSKVLAANKTRELLAPAYANGIGVLDGIKSVGSKVKSTVSAGLSKLKDVAGDVWSWAADGAKSMLSKVLSTMGVKTPSMAGPLGDMAKGAYGKVKDGAVGYIKGLLPDFSGGGGTGAGMAWPGYTRTSGYGMRWGRMHKGVDYAAPIGTPVPAQAAGRVTYSGWGGGYGNLVKIQGGNGYEYRYAHASRNLVNPGDVVRKGQTIQLVGSTGDSTGPHVHYEVYRNGSPINPDGHTSESGRNIGVGLKNLAGYADGAFNIDTKQLAWIAEGGWAESIISHDPGKRARSANIWKQTGEELGFMGGDNAEVLQLLEDIRDGVISFKDLRLMMSEREVGKMVEPTVTEMQGRNANKASKFK